MALETLKILQHHQRLDKKTDIYKFWDTHQNSDLASVCSIMLALPVTQVSVERTFSGLRYILNNLRYNMKHDIIDAIMVLRTNI